MQYAGNEIKEIRMGIGVNASACPLIYALGCALSYTCFSRSVVIWV